jgi:hypothetical protein
MDGQIGEILSSPYPRDRELCEKFFGPHFQTVKEVQVFLRCHLHGGTVTTHMMSSPLSWDVKSFQALYIACWIHHPVEKGTYMMPLTSSHWTPGANGIEDQIRAATGRLSSRISSHLSGKGYSASKDWHFLKGYHELLIQIEDLSVNHSSPHLMLKAEGHTTGLSGIVGHSLSYINKRFTGKGLVANKALYTYAKDKDRGSSGIVEERAAENYDKGYKSILKWLGLRGELITVREVMYKLFKAVHYPGFAPLPYAHFDQLSNEALGIKLKNYVVACRAKGGEKFRGPRKRKGYIIKSHEYIISDKKLIELDELAGSLIGDGELHTQRSYREVLVTPEAIDKSIVNLWQYEDCPMPNLDAPTESHDITFEYENPMRTGR